MLTILIVDDEKIEREGIKFLLKREGGEFHILEASNGIEALGILEKNEIDIMFTDIKMPYLSGIELAKRTRCKNKDMEIIICSGYGDFAYAQEAIRNDVMDYILKPVDPAEFHRMFLQIQEKISQKNKERLENKKQKGHLSKYFLLNYLYTGNEEFLQKAGMDSVSEQSEYRFYRMILANSYTDSFELEEDVFLQELTDSLHRKLYYLNLNAYEAVFFVKERYCNSEGVAEQLYQFFWDRYHTECCFAISREITDYRQLPEEFQQLEQLIGERFYQPKKHIYVNGREMEEEVMAAEKESEILRSISEDIRYKDIVRLRQNFFLLEVKYGSSVKFSEIYIKFVFSNILKEIYEVISLPEESALAKEIDRLYRCKTIKEVLQITEKAIEKFEEFVHEDESISRKEVSQVKNYIYHHYGENLNTEMLAGMVYLSPGYLSSVFKEETGINLNRFIRDVRMKKAKELLENTDMKIVQVAKEVGFSNNSYFARSFREYFGCTPESCRKGITGEEDK